MKLIFLLALTIFTVLERPVCAVNIDSLGIEKRSGQWMILHRVESGETIYGIARRYEVELDEVRGVNPGSAGGISVGQVLQVPYSTLDFVIHQVRAGETLYAISRRYGISTKEIRQWNDMTTLEIQVGDFLRIYEAHVPEAHEVLATAALVAVTTDEVEEVEDEVEEMEDGEEMVESFQTVEEGSHRVLQGETVYSISRTYGISESDLRSWNYLDGNELEVGALLLITNFAEEYEDEESQITEYIPTDSPFVSDTTTVALFPQVTIPFEMEQGLAEVIQGFDESEKYLALHRTAENGSLLMIRNEMNDQMVFVRVVGPLPDTGLNDKVVIKISKSAWEKIHAVNPKLRVKVYQFR